MKKSLIFIFGLALLMAGCKAHLPVAQQGGKDDVAYLLFVGQKEYGGEQVVQPLSLQKLLKPRKPVAKGLSMLSQLVPET